MWYQGSLGKILRNLRKLHRPEVCIWEHFQCTILRLDPDNGRVPWKDYRKDAMPCHVAPPENVPTTLVLPRLHFGINSVKAAGVGR